MTELQLKKNTLLETIRSNTAKEQEATRSNLAQEGFKDRETKVKEDTYQMEKDFQPFRKMESVSKTFSNVSSGLTGKGGLSSLMPGN